MRIFVYIIVTLIAIAGAMGKAISAPDTDSLVSVYYSLKDNDLHKIQVCYLIINSYDDVDSQMVWSQRMLSLSEKNKKNIARAQAYGTMGNCYFHNSMYEQSLESFFKSIYILDSINEKEAEDRIKYHIMIGNNYYELQMFEKSDEHYLLAMDMARQENDSAQLSESIRNLAGNYFTQKIYSKAAELFAEAVHLDSCTHEYSNLSCTYTNMANMFLTQFYEYFTTPDSMLVTQSKRMALNAMQVDSSGKYMVFWAGNILVESMTIDALINNYPPERMKQISDSVNAVVSKCDRLLEIIEVGDDIFDYDLRRVDAMMLDGRIKRARQMLDSLEVAVDGIESLKDDRLIDLYLTEYYFYKLTGNENAALTARLKYFEVKFHYTSIDYAVSATQNLAEADFKDRTRKLENQEFRRRLFFSFGLLLLALVIVFVLIVYRRSRRHNRELSEKNYMLIRQKEEINNQKEEIQAQSDELQEQNEIIIQKNKSITDSIHYASLIQRAALPDDDVMKSLFSDYFLIYRPLHIVAGDFYWASVMDKYKILVCADCTGHGVPGAFVSMLGISLLNDVVPSVIYNHGNAADILNELRTRLMRALGQDKRLYDEGKRSNMDGMDLTLIMIEEGTMNLQFAGAYRPLWLWRNGELIKYNPDKMPIGLYIGRMKGFTNNEIELQKNDVLYMFSDGIPDQFGYVDEERVKCQHFSTRRFAELITEVGALPMDEQKSRIENEVDTFKNGYKQLDDNILIGIRI